MITVHVTALVSKVNAKQREILKVSRISLLRYSTKESTVCDVRVICGTLGTIDMSSVY